MSVVEASSVIHNDYENYGPQQALTEISFNGHGFWHSDNGDINPSITFKMMDEKEVLSVQVIDRMDCCNDRFKSVEVRVGSTKSYKDAQSCGIKSYSGETTYK